MMKFFCKNVKIFFSLVICFILLSTTIVSSHILNNNNNKDTIRVHTKFQINEYIYYFLVQLTERFPILQNAALINILLDIFSPPNSNTAKIELIKNSNVGSAVVGETIQYQYKIINTGTIELTNIFLDDDKLGEILLNKTSLSPGQWAYGEAIYIVQTSDLPGPMINNATVNASYCDAIIGFGYVKDSDNESVYIKCDEPQIKIIKQADTNLASVGDTITYSYIVKNIGQIYLSNINVYDDKLGEILLNKTSLSPGQWAYGEYNYEVTLEDCDTTIINTATVNASYCDAIIGFGYVKDSDNESVYIKCDEPQIKIIKQADTNLASVGDTITYSYIVKNTGNLNLFELNVVDNPLGQVSLNTTTIYPGQWAYGKKTYVVKENDLPGPIINLAKATGYTCAQEMVVNDTILSIPLVISCQEEVWVDNKWFSQSDVNVYNQNLIWQVNAFNNFEDAISMVCECGTVYVRPGVYVNQILIDKSLNLIAQGDVTLYYSAPPGYTIDGSTEIFKPIIFAYGGEIQGNNVVSTGRISVKIDGFEIKGSSNTIAILYHNVESGCTPSLITNNEIYNSQIGIQIQGCTNDTTITWNRITHPPQTSNKIGILIESINDCEPDNVEIHHNRFDVECGYNKGICNKVSNVVYATFNWWNAANGPRSPSGYTNYDAITGRIADGYGDEVIGLVNFHPWAGIGSGGTIEPAPWGQGLLIFDGSDSFAYHLDGTSNENIDYWWKFGDGFYSDQKYVVRGYEKPGTYQVSLRVTTTDTDLHPSQFLRAWSYYTVHYTGN